MRIFVALGLGLALSPLLAAAQPVRAFAEFESLSTLPYHAPRFDRIQDGDFVPALTEGMRRHQAEITTIANGPAPATFQNTIVALEKSGQFLSRAAAVFYHLAQADTNAVLQKAESQVAPKLAAHRDALYMNAKLFARVEAVWNTRAQLKLDAEDSQLLKDTYEEFVHSGARLNGEGKARLRQINQRLSTLETEFEHKLLAATKAGALVVGDRKALAGLPEEAIAAAAKDAADRGAKGKFAIPLQNTTQQPALASLTDRATRQVLFQAKWTSTQKGDANDTRKIISEIAQLRARKAQLLGYATYAGYALYDQMATNPGDVQRFLRQLVPGVAAAQKREAARLQAQIDKERGGFALQPWDWDHYAEKVRKAEYDLDEAQIRPYFEANTVLEKGVFFAATRLYGITFKRRADFPVWHPDVRVYEVMDHDGKGLGLLYVDLYKRDNKSGGAWMGNLVDQSFVLGTRPVIYNVANLPKPAPGNPALISLDDVITLFHEFGHSLHGLFASQKYVSLSGTATARDFVEFPSQFNEHWALEPSVLANYALHHKTGKPMPAALVAKIKRAATFNQGYAMGEIVAAAQLDLKWHALPASAPRQDVDAFESAALRQMGLDTAHVPPRYRSSYFLHIWANGYSAAYYAYLWTQMLDASAYDWFRTHGGMTRVNGDRFRKLILSRGHTMDYGPMFRAFYGKDAEIAPLLRQKGLN